MVFHITNVLYINEFRNLKNYQLATNKTLLISRFTITNIYYELIKITARNNLTRS